MSDPQDNCTHGTPGHIACVECWQDRAKELKADLHQQRNWNGIAVKSCKNEVEKNLRLEAENKALKTEMERERVKWCGTAHENARLRSRGIEDMQDEIKQLRARNTKLCQNNAYENGHYQAQKEYGDLIRKTNAENKKLRVALEEIAGVEPVDEMAMQHVGGKSWERIYEDRARIALRASK